MILKGRHDVKTFQLHHYRYEAKSEEGKVSNTPILIYIAKNQRQSFLLFLVEEENGVYAPVTGQADDPAILSVLDLHSAAD
jgi:hypothetical protein